MQRLPLAVPIERFQRHEVRSNSAHKPRTLATLQRPGVLLVGKNQAWASPLCAIIEQVGAEVSFVCPAHASAEAILHGSYVAVLLDSCVPAEQRRSLTRGLLGSRVSLFYVYPVEMGCWWLPALLFGEDCHGAPAFRSREFLDELDSILGGRICA